MAAKLKKTNAMRILETKGLPYEVFTYEFDLEHLDAIHASESAGLDPQRVFKTIVMVDNEKNVFVFCLPAQFTISMKKARQLTGSKTMDLIRLEDLQKVTGYVRGGCSPLGMKKQFMTFIEEVAQLEDYIFVSGGQRGIQLKVKPDDLLEAAEARYADFTI
ncbi:MAG: Cys-tRNA(Pro) deacylase [Spirochaetia bacterium]|jgi:Cys-tRNA(Pro)/Cys-tRNA(Cys) deacylase|nr:Cys-tRNA(Pro) deacylase [Spirochaetia bacterium]